MIGRLVRPTQVEAPRRPSLLKRRPRAKESPDSTRGTSPLEPPDGILVDLPPLTPDISSSVMGPGKKRNEPGTVPSTRLK